MPGTHAGTPFPPKKVLGKIEIGHRVPKSSHSINVYAARMLETQSPGLYLLILSLLSGILAWLTFAKHWPGELQVQPRSKSAINLFSECFFMLIDYLCGVITSKKANR